jgi:peptidoglycan-N-acetylglucosamine deacetylase
VRAAEREIDHGIAAVEDVLYGKHGAQPVTPFFRFPGFASSSALLDLLSRAAASRCSAPTFGRAIGMR